MRWLMAESVHLYLKANGTDIKGESTQTSLGRQDSIECIAFSHEVIIDAGDHYETGTYRFWSPRLQLDPARVPKNEFRPEVATARMAPAIRSFLVWARFPVWEVERRGTGAHVTVRDMRFRVGAARFSASADVP